MIDSYDDDADEESKPAGPSEFAKMLDASFQTSQRKLSVGDKIRAEVLVAGKEDIFVSTGTMNDGVVPRRELMDENGVVSVKKGDVLELFVTQVRGNEIFLSPNKTAKNMADDLEDAFDMMIPVDGKVVEVVKGGFRVSLMAGKLAFCPVSQMNLKIVETPEEYVGKKFEFRITQFAEGGRNIVISRRKILEEEREVSAGSFFEEHHEGDVVPGKVARLEKFGAFIELAPGIDGLAHVSELAWSRVNDPGEVLTVGQPVTVKILKMEKVEGRMRLSLSLKQAGAEPWEGMPAHLRVGEVVEGKVTQCMKFGAFVQLVPDVEGLVPLGEMSYTKRVLRSDELFKEGETISVLIKEMNAETRKILLSFKDAGAGDPWGTVPQKFPVGTIIKGKIERKEGYGLFVRIDDGIVGLLPKSKAMEFPEYPFEKLRVGDDTIVQIDEIRREERRISLGVPKDPGADDWKGFVSKETATGFGTLADKMKAAMEKKKAK